MRMLLDTRVLLWALADAPELGAMMRHHLADAEAIYVSAASLWEVGLKAGLGKVNAPKDITAAITESGFTELPVTWAAATGIRKVLLAHRDPFDHMLVAQATDEQLRLVTADDVLLQAYPKVCLDARR